jgi:hypothetical protein
MTAAARRLAGVALLVLAPLASAAGAADTLPRDVLSPLVLQVVAPPAPVTGADDRVHLAYELSIVNQSDQLVTISRIDVLDATRPGTVVDSLAGERLLPAVRINGRESGTRFGPSHSGYAFLDVTFPENATLPHVITSPSRGPSRLAVVGAPARVASEPAVVVAPPLAGDGWVVGNGCCDSITAHRGATLSIDGTVHVAERFAIDFVRLGAGRRLYTGPRAEHASYAYYGADVYSVADGVVAATQDGFPDETPGRLPRDVTVRTAGGNYVVIDIGGGRFAFYAHLQPKSLRVRKGDRVRRGQVIGRLGNSGNTEAPHLHFHVMDGPSPLTANGLPFVFTAFEGQGVVTFGDALFAGEPAPIDPGLLAGPHRERLPLDLQVVGFPKP